MCFELCVQNKTSNEKVCVENTFYWQKNYMKHTAKAHENWNPFYSYLFKMQQERHVASAKMKAVW